MLLLPPKFGVLPTPAVVDPLTEVVVEWVLGVLLLSWYWTSCNCGCNTYFCGVWNRQFIPFMDSKNVRQILAFEDCESLYAIIPVLDQLIKCSPIIILIFTNRRLGLLVPFLWTLFLKWNYTSFEKFEASFFFLHRNSEIYHHELANGNIQRRLRKESKSVRGNFYIFMQAIWIQTVQSVYSSAFRVL